MSSRRVLIAHVPYGIRGGEDTHVESLADAYSRIGFEPIYYPEVRAPSRHSLREAGASLIPGRVSREFLGSWENSRAEFIHVHNAFPLLGPGFFGWAAQNHVPLLMTVHNHRIFCANGLALRDGKACTDCFDSVFAWRPLLRNCNKEYAKTIYHALAISELRGARLYSRAVQQFIAPSPYIEDLLLRFGIERNRISRIMSPVQARPQAVPRAMAPRYDLFYAGRLSAEKGIGLLLDAMDALPDLRLAIAGEGPERARIELARKPNVEYLGPLARERVSAAIEESRIGVLPSVCNESLGLFALECFSAGKRCVFNAGYSMDWMAEKPFFGVRAGAKLEDAIREALALQAPTSEEIEDCRRALGFDRFCAQLEEAIGRMPARQVR